MTKVASLDPRRKWLRKPEPKRVTGWRRVEHDGLPASDEFPVLVVPGRGLPFFAYSCSMCGRHWNLKIPHRGLTMRSARELECLGELERALEARRLTEAKRIGRELAGFPARLSAECLVLTVATEGVDAWIPVARLRRMVELALAKENL